MTMTDGQYAVWKRGLCAMLSGNTYRPNPVTRESTLLSFIAQMSIESTNAATISDAELNALNFAFRSLLSDSGANPATPTLANVTEFFSRLVTDSSASGALPPVQHRILKDLFRSTLSDNGFPASPSDTGLLRYINANTPRIGQIATRCAVNSAIVGTTTNSYMIRTAHIARDNISSLQVIDSNWYLSGGVETDGPGVITITASIEYPAGVFTQITYSGSATGTIASGADIVSDACLVTIPNGAQFWTRRYKQSTNGTPYGNMLDATASPVLDAIQINTTDKTMGGTITDGFGAANGSFFPAAIIGMTSKRRLLVIGDSRNAGGQDKSNTDYDRGEVLKSLGASYAYINMGVNGDLGASFLASHGKRVPFAQYCSAVICEYGINDMVIVSSATASAFQATVQSIRALFPGKPFYVCTLPPVTSSSDNWATVPGQTVHAGESSRVAWNNLVRSNAGGFTGGIELADFVESSRDSGFWKADGVTANLYCTDGTHENSNGNSQYVITIP